MAIAKKKKTLLVVNGPNLNFLGIREPGFYGTTTWEEIESGLRKVAADSGVELLVFQSNHEGAIVDFIQANMFSAAGVIINPAGYSKTGFSILDAIMIRPLPFIEVHLSNIYARGGWHAESVFTANALGCIVGFRGMVYDLALQALLNFIN
jgi:3-dehydroquinate dehydratase-2